MNYTEGSATIADGKAFINPKAKLSRDATIAYAKLKPGLKSALDATSATGIRGIRYCKELGLDEAVLLEINRSSYESLKSNVESNSVKNAKYENASVQEFCNREPLRKFDLIDVDPFGSPAPYLFDILKVAHENSIVAFTATDTAVLCGAHLSACIKTYDSVPMHNELGHEAGIRILIGFFARLAAQFNYGIEVGLSFSYMHYMRTIVKLIKGSKSALSSVKKLGFAYKCRKCGWLGSEQGPFTGIGRCPLCGSEIETSGRMWLGSLIGDDIRPRLAKSMEEVMGSDKREYRFMESLSLEPDIPFYYSIPKLTKLMHLPSISELALAKKLEEAGHVAAITHFEKNCVKTDATIEEIKDAITSISKNGA